MRKRRIATVLSALCIAASTLAGCGEGGEDVPARDEQQQEQEDGGEEDQQQEQERQEDEDDGGEGGSRGSY